MTTPVAGPAEASLSDHADCGTLAGNAWIQAFVRGAPGLPTLDNATAYQVASAINALNVPGLTAVDEYPDDLNSYIAGYVPYGDGVMAGVRVDSWNCAVDPNGRAEHWIDPYDEAVHFYNCWYATDDTVDPATLQAAYMASGTFVGCVRISYSPPRHSTEADDMASTKTRGWDWPERGAQCVLQQYGGSVFFKRWDPAGGWQTEWEPIAEAVDPDDGPAIFRTPGQWHLTITGADHHVIHGWLGDTGAWAWHFEELP